MYSWRELWELYQLTLPLPQPELPPRYNVAPTQNIVVVRMAQDATLREIAEVRWGLVPGWAKDVSIGNRIINARAETIAEKPALRRAFQRRRCLIPARGFYEWVREGHAKVPYYFHHCDGAPITFAGLWEQWTAPDGSPLESCCIVTTTANELVSPLHYRMPVILEPESFDTWLNADDSRLG